MPLIAGRPSAAPLVRVFSCLVPKVNVPIRIVADSTASEGTLVSVALGGGFERSASDTIDAVAAKP